MPTVSVSINIHPGKFPVRAVFLTLCLCLALVISPLGPQKETEPRVKTLSEQTAKKIAPNQILQPAPAAATAALPDDRYAGQQWSLHSSEQHLGASSLFDTRDYLASSTEVVVAVVDSGVILDHEDLNFLPGYDFIHDANVANDGDGRDHDPGDPGDWVNQNDLDQQTVSEGCPITASKWHGTAISGIIGATSFNSAGIAGGSPSVALVPVRVTGKCGGYVADLIDGIRWSAGLKVDGVADNPYPAQVINLSVGFPGSCSDAMQSAVNDAVGAGAIVVTASTNSAAELDTEPYSPASCDNVITVAATARDGSVTSYSALGKSVFISAPGGTISDGIITTQNDGSEAPLAHSSYGFHYGTSIAAAHVSAAIANLLSYQPDLTKKQIEQLLSLSVSSTDDDSRCSTGQCGLGRLNAVDAIEILASGELPEPAQTELSETIPVQLAATNSSIISDDPVFATTAGGNSGIGAVDLKLLLLLLLSAITYRTLRRTTHLWHFSA